MLSNKRPYGEYGANKYYIVYLNGGLRPLHIIIKDIKLYANHMNILANDNGTKLRLYSTELHSTELHSINLYIIMST